MLRPATPLAVLLLVAFALLLISVLSTPIVKGIKLGSFQGVDFGVFGYCKGSRCSGATVGYDPGMYMFRAGVDEWSHDTGMTDAGRVRQIACHRSMLVV